MVFDKSTINNAVDLDVSLHRLIAHDVTEADMWASVATTNIGTGNESRIPASVLEYVLTEREANDVML